MAWYKYLCNVTDFLENYVFLVYMFYPHLSYQTSIVGKNCAYYIRIFMIVWLAFWYVAFPSVHLSVNLCISIVGDMHEMDVIHWSKTRCLFSFSVSIWRLFCRVAPESGSGQNSAFLPNPAKIRLRAKFHRSRMLLPDEKKMHTSNASSMFRTKIAGASRRSLFCLHSTDV